MSVTRTLSALILGASALLLGSTVVLGLAGPAWLPPAAGAAVLRQYLPTKGFVVAKHANSLTVLSGSTRVLVVITSQTRVVGRRVTFTSIVRNDIVEVEGRRTAEGRLVADRIEVVFAADSARLQRLPEPPAFELTVRL